MTCMPYINDEKNWSRDVPYTLYMACTAYIYVELSWCREFPYSVYMACTAYEYDKKNLVQRLLLQHARGLCSLYI
jgi:hypothetical protein